MFSKIKHFSSANYRDSKTNKEKENVQSKICKILQTRNIKDDEGASDVSLEQLVLAALCYIFLLPPHLF